MEVNYCLLPEVDPVQPAFCPYIKILIRILMDRIDFLVYQAYIFPWYGIDGMEFLSIKVSLVDPELFRTNPYEPCPADIHESYFTTLVTVRVRFFVPEIFYAFKIRGHAEEAVPDVLFGSHPDKPKGIFDYMIDSDIPRFREKACPERSIHLADLVESLVCAHQHDSPLCFIDFVHGGYKIYIQGLVNQI